MLANNPVRLAIIGAGTIGGIHGLCAAALPEAQVTTVWSRSSDRARALAERLGARPCDTLEQALAAPDVDAALICTPTFLHREHALSAIRAGKHVLCEKPLARSLDAAEEIMQAAQQAGVHLQVGHVLRFFPDYMRMRELVKQGAVGQPAVVRLARASAFPHGSGDWHNDMARSGGAVLDMGIHDLDWLLWTFGPAERVYARGALTRGLHFLDYALLTLRMRSGLLAHVECSWAEAAGFWVSAEVAGDQGLLCYDSRQATPLQLQYLQPPPAPGVQVPGVYTEESPYLTQLRHFVACIRGQASPRIAPQEAYEALRLALAALDSIATGRAVTL